MSEKKKTICIVMGGHFSESRGGAQYQAQCVVEALEESRKYNIVYLTRVFDKQYVPEGYKIVQIARPVGIRKHFFIFDTRKLLRLLNEIDPDVIYQRGLKAYTGVIAYFTKFSACRSVFHIASDHSLIPTPIVGNPGMRFLKQAERFMENYGLTHVDDVVAQTEQQSKLLMQRCGRKPSAVIPNFHPLPNEDATKCSDEVRIVWVANFKPIKRPEIFVQLARDLAFHRNLRFVMIGSGDQMKYAALHAEIEKLPNLSFLGQLPIDEVNKHLAAGHLFVNTSTTEGFPNTFIQAWMRKVPTLSLEVNPDNILSSERFGFCAYTYERLREKVCQLADDTVLREKMGLAGQQHAFAYHSQAAVQKLLELLDRQKLGR